MPSMRPARFLFCMVLCGLALSASSCVPRYQAHHGAAPVHSGPSSAIPIAGPSVPWSDGSNPPTGSLPGLLVSINAMRTAQGAPSLTWHDGLAAVAEFHSDNMTQHNYLDLVSPDGHDVFQSLVAANPQMHFDDADAFVFTAPVGSSILPLLTGNPASQGALLDPTMTQIAVQSNFRVPSSNPAVVSYTIILGKNVTPP